MPFNIPPFLTALLNTHSPSGAEHEAQKVIDAYVKPHAKSYEKDTMGNRIATIGNSGNPTLMFSGHMDEIAFIIKYIDDKGFIYFDQLGGHDLTIISGRSVTILNKNGNVQGVTGKRAIHLLTPEERKKVPEMHDLWVDIGAKSKKEALKRIALGDPFVYDTQHQLLHKSIIASRALDDKAGCYAVNEAFIRLSKIKNLKAKVASVSTTQEEVGVRGATVASYTVNPNIGIAVDVFHATDHPGTDPRKHEDLKLGGGPIVARGPNINPFVFERILSVAKKAKIPHQIAPDGRPTGTDARVIQMARQGVAAGVISIPLRYMHTPNELVDLKDLENTVKLLVEFAKSLKKGENGVW